MKTYLFVPYEEKDQAKRLGAWWDAGRKQWYVPDGMKTEPFSRWLGQPAPVSTTQTADLLPSWLPSFCSGTKLSIFLTADEQTAIKRRLSQQTQGCCSLCQTRVSKSYLYPDWAYLWGEHPVQKLKTILLVCENCHRVKYYGINRMNGFEPAMLAHLARVRGCSVQEAEAIANEREQLFFKLSSAEWDLDVSALAELGFPPNATVVENEKRRRRKENTVNAQAVFAGLQQGWY